MYVLGLGVRGKTAVDLHEPPGPLLTHCREACQKVDKSLSIELSQQRRLPESKAFGFPAFPSHDSREIFDGKTFPHHHPAFDIDEKAMPVGLAIMAETTCRLLEAKGSR